MSSKCDQKHDQKRLKTERNNKSGKKGRNKNGHGAPPGHIGHHLPLPPLVKKNRARSIRRLRRSPTSRHLLDGGKEDGKGKKKHPATNTARLLDLWKLPSSSLPRLTSWRHRPSAGRSRRKCVPPADGQMNKQMAQMDRHAREHGKYRRMGTSDPSHPRIVEGVAVIMHIVMLCCLKSLKRHPSFPSPSHKPGGANQSLPPHLRLSQRVRNFSISQSVSSIGCA
ncbi:hypothetical protein LZ30DRAFT_22268 [Colletotrichum cereale]|nr:hypothetical protein LZ30DRAFT_22268 [Colletotrichum cereale]